MSNGFSLNRLGVFAVVLALVVLGGCVEGLHTPGAKERTVIIYPNGATSREILAAKEVQRYIYQRTGQLNRLKSVASIPKSGEVIVVCNADNALLDSFEGKPARGRLKDQEYILRTIDQNDRRILIVAGGSDTATLYAAYRFAEILGVRYYLHGDVIPDEKIAWEMPQVDERAKPLFELRGIQPFHDFPEGPDWWSVDDYKAIFAQLPKMRMNFFGLHTYPEGRVGPEPTVWIGQKDEMNQSGEVTAGYPSRHVTTHSDGWGYKPMDTSEYAAGAGQLFERDDYGADYMVGVNPWKKASVERQNKLFNDVGNMLNDTFTFAGALGIKTCIGTETPLTIPAAVKERLKAGGKDPADPAVVLEVYEAMFTRIARTHPLDYYWLWTNESWTWGKPKAEEIKAVEDDMLLALDAMKNVGSSFTLATCGWVLGPPGNRDGFDKLLPKDSPLACINRNVGFAPVETGFAAVKGRPLWAIPWVEDDPDMIAAQLWVGRLRRDAADALAYGCTGLMGIHWRTRVLGPNMSALAKAGWEQKQWNPEFGKPQQGPVVRVKDVHVGGTEAHFPNQPMADTDIDAVYQNVRYNLNAYELDIPNGSYSVTLQFSEPAYKEKGKRVFGVKLQGEQVIDKLDVFEKVGANKALDLSFPDIKVDDETLRVDFVHQVEFPLIAGIVIEGKTIASNQLPGQTFARRINCAGVKTGDHEADLPAKGSITRTLPRDLKADDFYADWAAKQFGDNAAGAIAKIFIRLDGVKAGSVPPSRATNLPRPSDWRSGPGGLIIVNTPWRDVKKQYAFLDELQAFREQVKGKGNLERFDYWLNTFRYMRSMAQVNCARGELDRIMKKITESSDSPAKKDTAVKEALGVRVKMARLWEQLMADQLRRVTNASELGEIANIEQHSGITLKFLTTHDKTLAELTGKPLPDTVRPSKEYTGPARLIVPTVRSSLLEGENLTLKAITLGSGLSDISIRYRPMGKGRFRIKPLEHINRGVYSVTLTADRIASGLEYYIEARYADGKRLVFPPTAPQLNQTVVIMPQGE